MISLTSQTPWGTHSQSKEGKNPKITVLPLFRIHWGSLTTNHTHKTTLFANTGITKKAIHAKVQKFQASLPALEIEGCKQALKAPLAAFLLHFPFRGAPKTDSACFAQVGELRNKQIWVFLIFSQNVLGNWWPSFNLSLKWNISAITTQSHSKNFKLGSSKECQDFKLQCITSCQGGSKRREGYRRGKKKECAKLGVVRSRNKDTRAENTTVFSPISLSWTLQSLSYFCFLHFYMLFFFLLAASFFLGMITAVLSLEE